MAGLGRLIGKGTAFAAALLCVTITPSVASTQLSDMSPTLLIETGPSDNPDYRRMVFVKYLAGNQVTASYKAYNRSEFIQIQDTTPNGFVAACANGRATTLDEIRAYEMQEANARASQRPPAITHFCIKSVPNWEAGNRATYLDPIFEGMPYAATLNN
ncbi:MAG: hypothetical protein AAFP97_01055 [Pseudomonadota bacterium]